MYFVHIFYTEAVIFYMKHNKLLKDYMYIVVITPSWQTRTVKFTSHYNLQ